MVDLPPAAVTGMYPEVAKTQRLIVESPARWDVVWASIDPTEPTPPFPRDDSVLVVAIVVNLPSGPIKGELMAIDRCSDGRVIVQLRKVIKEKQYDMSSRGYVVAAVARSDLIDARIEFLERNMIVSNNW